MGMSADAPRRRRARGPRGPESHEGAGGFSWTLVYPERASAPIGSRKPRARIDFKEGEPLHLPVSVARELSAWDGPEAESRAEVLWRVRASADKVAWSRVVDMASRREYSALEATRRLERDGFSSACAKRAVDKAVGLRVIDDARFAECFVRSKLAAGWGPLRIERELSQRGVEPSGLPGWPEAFLREGGGGSVLDRAREALGRRPVPEKNAYPKLMRFLVSRGYPLAVARDAVSERLSAADDA